MATAAFAFCLGVDKNDPNSSDPAACKILPKVIETEAENEAALAFAEALMEKGAEPREVLRDLMERIHLQASDLADTPRIKGQRLRDSLRQAIVQ